MTPDELQMILINKEKLLALADESERLRSYVENLNKLSTQLEAASRVVEAARKVDWVRGEVEGLLELQCAVEAYDRVVNHK